MSNIARFGGIKQLTPMDHSIHSAYEPTLDEVIDHRICEFMNVSKVLYKLFQQ